jgi:ATP-dependent RNA helicase DDX46/PRP5
MGRRSRSVSSVSSDNSLSSRSDRNRRDKHKKGKRDKRDKDKRSKRDKHDKHASRDKQDKKRHRTEDDGNDAASPRTGDVSPAPPAAMVPEAPDPLTEYAARAIEEALRRQREEQAGAAAAAANGRATADFDDDDDFGNAGAAGDDAADDDNDSWVRFAACELAPVGAANSMPIMRRAQHQAPAAHATGNGHQNGDSSSSMMPPTTAPPSFHAPAAAAARPTAAHGSDADDESEDDDDGEEDDDAAAGLANLLSFVKKVNEDKHEDADATAAKTTGRELAILGDDVAEVGGGKAAASQIAKPKVLKDFDHSSYVYPPLRKDFFIPPSDVARLTEEEVAAIHKELDGAKVIGERVPPPIRTWNGIGLNDEAMKALEKGNYLAPFAVQSLAIPILMSGRDLLAIAKTGSGKTLAYLLPLLRHVHYQPRCRAGEGPIGLVLAPTHELAAQIFSQAKLLGSVMGLKCVPAYGGTALRECIGQCKGGSDILIATPGRMFELLVSNRGAVMNLRRCTMVVIDEADRMFDEGFSGHVAGFLGQVRPDRQVAMVSSTMPREVRAMAKQFLAKDYIELSVGGRPCPSTNITQTIEFFDHVTHPDMPDPRFLRLLQILGEECPHERSLDDHLVMVFVGSKELCDKLYVGLTDRGYRDKVGTLYSGMDQADRGYVLRRFETKDISILITTAVAERGIDVHDLDLVVNYSMPDHYEAYVNRIGRTGRAGRKGRAITFLVRDTPDETMAGDLVRALESSNNDVPDSLRTMAQQVNEKLKLGLVKRSSNYRRGFGNAKGYRFTSAEKKKEEREAAKAMGLGSFLSDGEDEDLDYNSDDDGPKRKVRDPRIVMTTEEATAADDAASGGGGGGGKGGALIVHPEGERQLTPAERIAAAKQLAQTLTTAAQQLQDDENAHLRMYQARYDVNDYGEKIRKKLISRKFLDEVQELTDTSITVKGVYKDKRNAHAGKEPLHLEIRGKEQMNITSVFRKFDELIEEITEKMMRAGGAFSGGKKSF